MRPDVVPALPGERAVAVPSREWTGRRRAATRFGLAAVLLGALAACGGNDTFGAGASPSPVGAGGGSLVVGGADFTEMQIMEAIYADLLRQAGYQVDIKTAGSREIYAKSLVSGEIDVVPEYAATMAEYLNKAVNGPDAKAIATTDAATTIAAAAPLAAKQGLKFLEPAQALAANGFYIKQSFATEKNLKTLSDLAALKQPIVLAAGDECPTRPFCGVGLKRVYGLNIAKVTGDAYNSATGKQKVVNGQAQLGLTGTTDGTLKALGLVVLADDKKLQAADNLVPVVNTRKAGDARITGALDELAPVLTTADLTELNAKVDGQRQKPADVAKAYLTEKGLLKG